MHGTDIGALLEDTRLDLGVTLLFISHGLSKVVFIPDQFVFPDAGRVVGQGVMTKHLTALPSRPPFARILRLRDPCRLAGRRYTDAGDRRQCNGRGVSGFESERAVP